MEMKKNGLLFTICGIAILAGVFVRSFSLVNAILAIVGVIIYEVGVMIRIKNKWNTTNNLTFPTVVIQGEIMKNLLLLINSILLGVLCIVSFIQDSFFEKIRIIFIIVCILQSVLSILVLMKLKKRNRLFGTVTVAGIGVVTGAIAGWVGGFITGGFGW